jgi:general secretion pathway protein K
MKISSHFSSPPRGSALVAVIWLISILALAAMTAIQVVEFDSEIAGSRIHGFRARQLAEMGIAVAANPAVKLSDPLLKQMSDETGEGFEAHIVSEGQKFNINAILLRGDRQLLQGIFVDWGLTIDEAQAQVDALTDWVDADDEVSTNGAESKWYLDQGRINQPFNRPFYNLEEMRLVRGMDKVESLKPDWRDWFTIWSTGQLDLNVASAELIAAAVEIPVEQAKQIPDMVIGPDGIRDTQDDKPFGSTTDALALVGVDVNTRPNIAARVMVNDATQRLESIGTVAGAQRKIVVIVRNRTGRPAVLERTEEVIPH